MRLRRCLLLSVCSPFLLLSLAAARPSSAVAGAAPTRAPLPLGAPLEDKNFDLLAALERSPAVRSALLADPALGVITRERGYYLKLALKSCKQDIPCTIKAFLWTDEEIGAVSHALRDLYRGNRALRAVVDNNLRTSGAYLLFAGPGGEGLLVNAWESCAHGLNNIHTVYGDGAAPRYPQIDSISLDIQSDDSKQHVATFANQVAAQTPALFFEPSLKAALDLLLLNHRDEAARFEPMEQGENKAALAAIPAIQWSKYSYSVIVVPGAGPEDPNVALSAAGRQRTALAAQRYHAGKAPLILVSGGYVHPAQTRFSEAIEMKRALLEDYHVPESAILVDPHARHTTTNLRNAAREIYRYDIPMTKPVLVVSDQGQIRSIASESFADRCLKELGYLPYRLVNQLSETDLVILPRIESLQVDPMDPLDP